MGWLGLEFLDDIPIVGYINYLLKQNRAAMVAISIMTTI